VIVRELKRRCGPAARAHMPVDPPHLPTEPEPLAQAWPPVITEKH